MLKFIKIFLQIIFAVCVSQNLLFSQYQIGPTLYGDSAYHYWGSNVAISENGKRIAASSPIANQSKGEVRVLEWNGQGWEQIGQTIIGTEGREQSGLGLSISRDGKRIAIGAPYNDIKGQYSGKTRILELKNGAWQQLGSAIYSEGKSDFSGLKIELAKNGNRIAIGAHFNKGKGWNAGHVRIFDWINEEWEQVGNDIDARADSDKFGAAFSMTPDGEYIAIGSIGTMHRWSNDTGYVQVYKHTPTAWVLVGETIEGSEAQDQMGWSVSLSADAKRLAIGSPAWRNDVGRVRVYDWNGYEWIQAGSSILGDQRVYFLGACTDLSDDGNTLVIGARQSNVDLPVIGHIRIYHWDGTDWFQKVDNIYGESEGDALGYPLDLTPDGKMLVLGSPINDLNAEEAGYVKVFDLTQSPTGIPSPDIKTLSISPNPTSSFIHLIGLQDGNIRITDGLGREILFWKKMQEKLDVSGLRAGIYYLHVQNGQQYYTGKFIKAP